LDAPVLVPIAINPVPEFDAPAPVPNAFNVPPELFSAALEPIALILAPVFPTAAPNPYAFTFVPPTPVLTPKHIYLDALTNSVGTLLNVTIPEIFGKTVVPVTINELEMFTVVADNVVIRAFAAKNDAALMV
jgi:hypothetical protein